MEQEQIIFALCAVFVFILGCVIGSFLNVCVCRIPRGESVVAPRSRCPKCLNRIAWYDNVPLLSWLLLGARCRHCGKAISWQYPLVEGITGALFSLIFWKFGFVAATPVYMLLACGLVLATFADLTEWIIPNEVTLTGIPLALVFAVAAMWFEGTGLRVMGFTNPVFDAIIGIEVGGGILFLLDKATRALMNKRGMGGGDVKLLAMLGGFFGWPGVLMVLAFASTAGAVVGLSMRYALRAGMKEAEGSGDSDNEKVGMGGLHGMPGTVLISSVIGLLAMLAERRQHTETGKVEIADDEEEFVPVMGRYLPFGPWLCLAGLVVMFFGNEIFDAYMVLVNPPMP